MGLPAIAETAESLAMRLSIIPPMDSITPLKIKKHSTCKW